MEIQIAGFDKVEKHLVALRRLIISVEGREKEGKTTFGLTSPSPIALFDLDIGMEGVVEKFADQKDIYATSFNYRDATNQAEWVATWEKLKALYLAALKNPHIRTIIWDTATEIWELVRLARFGKLSQVLPHHYGPVNAEFRDLLRKAYDSNKNFILVHKMRAEYINDKRTGAWERAGFSDIGYIVQVNLEVWRRESAFGLTIKDCRQNAALAGSEFEEPMNTFPFVASCVYPDTDSGQWQ